MDHQILHVYWYGLWVVNVFYLYGLWVINMCAERHQYLWDKRGDIIWEGRDAGTQAKNSSMALDEILCILHTISTATLILLLAATFEFCAAHSGKKSLKYTKHNVLTFPDVNTQTFYLHFL